LSNEQFVEHERKPQHGSSYVIIGGTAQSKRWRLCSVGGRQSIKNRLHGRTDGGHDEPVPGQLPGVVGYIEDGDGGRHWPAVSSMLV